MITLPPLRKEDRGVRLTPDFTDFGCRFRGIPFISILCMHELSIVESLLNLALQNAEKANARKIIGIRLVVGDYTGVMEDAVNFYFAFLSKNTIAAGAKISYTHVPGQLRCRDCDSLFPLQKHDYQCPKCGGKRVEIVGGRELYIDNMEVE